MATPPRRKRDTAVPRAGTIRSRVVSGSSHWPSDRLGRTWQLNIVEPRLTRRELVRRQRTGDRSSPRRVCDAGGILVVDGNNVIGAIADGWWRDPPAAVQRLLRRLQCLGEPATLVLDVPQADLSEGDHDGIVVRYATRRGRDAADDVIRELVAEVPGTTVVTSDRALRRDVEAAGATVVGAGTFLAQLDAAGC